MSYNIDTWKTKKLDSFRVSLAALVTFTEDQRSRGWDARIVVPNGVKYDWLAGRGFSNIGIRPGEPHRIAVEIMESTIAGMLQGNYLAVEEIDISGEGSGSAWHDHLFVAFTQSTGTLEAVLVWEGGDSISRVTVSNGEVTEEDIEL